MVGKLDLKALLNRPLPVALTKAEALEYAAGRLDEMATGVEMSALILDSLTRVGFRPQDLEVEMRPVLESLKKGLVDAKLQVSAAQAGARAIRELALEERIFAARAGAGASVSK